MSSRRSLVGAACFAAVLALALLAFRSMGTWLVIEEPLRPSRAIVVLGGQVPFRAMEAAALFRQGWAREVWVTQGGEYEEDKALKRLGIDRPPDHAYSREVLLRLGVPPGATRILDGPNQNTADEVRTIARELEAVGGDRAVVVTSKYHSRRVRAIWNALVGSRPEAIVRYAGDDPFQPAGWWRDTSDALTVSREWLGLLNLWSGFPVRSQRGR